MLAAIIISDQVTVRTKKDLLEQTGEKGPIRHSAMEADFSGPVRE